jgi:hypothetical protein
MKTGLLTIRNQRLKNTSTREVGCETGRPERTKLSLRLNSRV